MRCRLWIILLVILLVGCTASGPAGEADPTTAETGMPVLTFTPTPLPIPVSKTPRPTRTPTLTPVPTYNPFIDPVIRYQDGVIPPAAQRRLGMGLIGDVKVSPDRQSFALGTTTGVYVFDSQTCDLLWSAGTRAPIGEINWVPMGEIKWSPSGDKLAIVLPDTDSVLVWDAGGQFIAKLAKSNLGTVFDWSPDGEQIVTAEPWLDERGFPHGTVTIWNVETGEESDSYEIDTSQDAGMFIEGLRWSPDGQYIIVGTESLHVTLVLDLAAGNILSLETPEDIRHPENEYIEFSPDGSHLLTFSGWLDSEGSQHGSSYAVIWDMESLGMLYPLKPDQVSEFWQVADAGWSPNGQYVAVIYGGPLSSSVFVIWDVATGENVFTYEAEDYFLNNLDWSHDGTTVIATGSIRGNDEDEGALFLVDLSDMNHITIENEVARSPEYSGWLSDDKLLLASTENLYVRDMPTNRYDVIIRGSYDVFRLAQSPDEPVIAALQYDANYEPEVAAQWDYRTWERLEFDQKVLPPDNWLFSNGSRYELVTPTKYTYILDQPVEPGPHGVWESINIKLLDSGRTILDYSEADAYVYSNAVSLDGRYIAFGFGYPDCYVCPRLSLMEQAYILLFDTETETYVKLYGHTGQVTSLQFLPDGDLVSGSQDGTIIVWDVP